MLNTIVFAQNPIADLQSIKNGKVKIHEGYFFNDTSIKYSIAYLNSYSVTKNTKTNTSNYFVDATKTYSYMVLAIKNDETYTLDDQKYYLSDYFAQDRAKDLKSTLVSHKITFIDGKKTTVNDFYSSKGNQLYEYKRSYLIPCKEYSFQVYFTIGYKSNSEGGSLEEIKQKYLPIFENISQSVKISCDCDFLNSNDPTQRKKEEITTANKKSGYWVENVYYNDLYSFHVAFPKKLEYDFGTAASTVARAIDRPNYSVYAITASIQNNFPNKPMSEIKDFYIDVLKSSNPGIKNMKTKDGWLNNKKALIIEFNSLEKSGEKVEEYYHKQIVYNGNGANITLTLNLPSSNLNNSISLEFDRFIESFRFSL